MKVSIDNQQSVKSPSQVNFKGYETEKSKIGDLLYTFNFPYDTKKYNGYVDICLVKKDENGNYHIVEGLTNKNLDVGDIKDNRQKKIAAMSLPLNSGKTVVNLSKDYGIPVNTAFGYHFKLVPKNGGVPIYQVDSGDIVDFTPYGQAHDIYNIIVPNGTKGLEVGSQIHFILVSSMKPEMFAKTDIHTAATVEEAIELAKKLTGKERLSTYIMPYAANTMASMNL